MCVAQNRREIQLQFKVHHKLLARKSWANTREAVDRLLEQFPDVQNSPFTNSRDIKNKKWEKAPGKCLRKTEQNQTSMNADTS